MDYVGSTLVHVGDLGSTSWRGGEGVEEAVGDIKWKAARCSAAWLPPALRELRVLSGGRDGLCVHGKRVIFLEAPVMLTIPLRGDLSVAVPGCSCLPRPRTSDNGTQRTLSTSPF